MSKKCILSIILYVLGGLLIIYGIWATVELIIVIKQYVAQGMQLNTHALIFQAFDYVLKEVVLYYGFGILFIVLGFFNCKLNGLTKNKANITKKDSLKEVVAANENSVDDTKKDYYDKDTEAIIKDNSESKKENVSEDVIEEQIEEPKNSEDVKITNEYNDSLEAKDDNKGLDSLDIVDETLNKDKKLSKKELETIVSDAINLTPSALSKREESGWTKVDFTTLEEAKELAKDNKVKFVVSKKDKTLIDSLEDIKYLITKPLK
ncbi:MAG: tetraspanin family protein [Bacilli bacterium]|jgi:hypothetical protein|nr:tetraspanin family protein [Bacilli bacterium]